MEKEIGKVAHYFGKVGVGIIALSDGLKIGDRVHIKGQTADFFEDVSSMQIEHVVVTEAKAGESAGIKVSQKVHEGDRVYKVT
ncbi:MAG: hypothetical protein WC515_01415 [Candidatus Omnitrophota bacterium]